MGDREPAEFRVWIEVDVAWGEMDALGHVNNTVYFRWFESARMAYFERIGWTALAAATGVGPILHSTAARYRSPVRWPDRIRVGIRAHDLAADRFATSYQAWSQAQGRRVAEGSGLIVAFDYQEHRKADLPAPVRAGILALEAGP